MFKAFVIYLFKFSSMVGYHPAFMYMFISNNCVVDVLDITNPTIGNYPPNIVSTEFRAT